MSKKRGLQILLSSVITAVILLQYSCFEEGPKTYENAVISLKPMNLILSTKSLSFNTYESSTQTIMVAATDIAWEFVDIPDWITIKPSTGNGNDNVKVTCKLNEGVTDRIGIITFRSRNSEWNFSTTFSVSQVRGVYSAIPDKKSIEVPWTTNQTVIKINANSDNWTVSVPESFQSWCSVTKNDDNIIINCAENPSRSIREGYVLVNTEDKSSRVSIKQAAIEFNLTNDSTVLYFSDQQSVSYIYVDTYSGVNWMTAASQEWITVSPTEGKGKGTVAVSVSENKTADTRTGEVYVYTQNDRLSMNILQTGKYLTVYSKDLEFASTGGEMQVSLKTNDGWKASADCNWIELSPSSGSNDCDLLLTIGDYNSADIRTGHVTITPTNSNPVVLEVVQRGRCLTLSDTIVVFFYGDTVKSISVKTDGKFTVKDDCSWIDTEVSGNHVVFRITGVDMTKSLTDSISFSLTGLDSGSLTKKLYIYLRGIADSYVDLGLSVKWATCNLGAMNSEDYGDYYAWGELEPYYEKTGYWTDNGSPVIWKGDKTGGYASSSYNVTDYKDAATAILGDMWRLPTEKEAYELFDSQKCSYTITTLNGVQGVLIRSKVNGYTDKTIFLPFNGYRRGTRVEDDGMEANYWTKTPYGNTSDSKSEAIFVNEYVDYINGCARLLGYGIRPVKMFGGEDVSSVSLNYTVMNLTPSENRPLTVTGIKKDEYGTEIRLYPEMHSSDTTVATIVDGIVYAKGVGSCVISGSLPPYSLSCNVTVTDPYDKDMVHEFVDLGLSVQWATANLGALRPEMPGDYYAWGETDPYYEIGTFNSGNTQWLEGKLSGYCWDSYFDSNDGTAFNKYFTNGGKSKLDAADDAAYVKWGGEWRMPTKDEFGELINDCDWKLTQIRVGDGYMKGYTVSGKKQGYENDSIFLPISGYVYNDHLTESINDRYLYGRYWASTLSEADKAYSLNFGSDKPYTVGHYRDDGLVIRPVHPYGNSEYKDIELNFYKFQLVPGGKLELVVSGVRQDNFIVKLGKKAIVWQTDNSSVATVSDGIVTALGVGTCTITSTIGSLTAECEITVPDSVSSTPQMVDMGVSVKWATFNVGACSPEMFGDYYAWGETDTYYEYGNSMLSDPDWKDGKASGYSRASYSYRNSLGYFTKYCRNYNYSDGKTILEWQDDVATMRWGGDWRMPTQEEFSELIHNSTWVWTAQNGIKGLLLTSMVEGYKDRSIFLPATGIYTEDGLVIDDKGYYWSKSLCSDYGENFAYAGSIQSDLSGMIDYVDRFKGCNIRPVSPFTKDDIDLLLVSDTVVRMVPGEPYQLSATGRKKDGHILNNPNVVWESTDESVATVSESGMVTAVGPGKCSITANFDSELNSCYVEVIDMSSVVPEYIDLGLSVKWATFNVGSYSPEVAGDYFAWGETEPYYDTGHAKAKKTGWKSGKQAGYIWKSYSLCREGSLYRLTKYCSDAGYGNNGYTDSKTTLDPENDAAHVLWGGDWRMPTIQEFEELMDREKCTWKLTEENGIYGYNVVSKVEGFEGRSIFLPYTGFRSNTSYTDFASSLYIGGYYWSSTLSSLLPYKASCFQIDSYYFGGGSYNKNTVERYKGYCIRPVHP